MTYEKYLDYSSELQHAWFQRNKSNSANIGFRKKKPKYFKKDNGRYFYSQAEWDAHIRKLRGGVKKTADRFKKSAKRTLTGAKRSAYRTGMSLSRKAKSAAVTAKRASQSFSRMASKKMGEFRAAASKQIERGKMMAAVAMGHVRGQMRRFSDKVAKPGVDRAQKVLDRIKSNASRKINDIKIHASDVIEKGKKCISDDRSLKKTSDLYAKQRRVADEKWEDAAKIDKELAEKIGPPSEHDYDSQARAHEESRRARANAEFLWDRFQDRARQKNQSKKEFIDSVLKLIGYN